MEIPARCELSSLPPRPASKWPLKRPRSGSASKQPAKAARPGKQQMLLDLGQKSRRGQCPNCGMLWVSGDAADEAQHAAFCGKFVSFPGWKHERVVERYQGTELGDGARIVEVRSGDPASHLAKLEEVQKVMDKDMGFARAEFQGSRRAYVYVAGKKVRGCVIAEPITSALRAEGMESQESNEGSAASKSNSDSDSQDSGFSYCPTPPEVKELQRVPGDSLRTVGEPVPALVGIHQMWTHPECRRQGIATRLLDAARKHMIYGTIVPQSQMAFSQPTLDGQLLAAAYTGSPFQGTKGAKGPLVYNPKVA